MAIDVRDKRAALGWFARGHVLRLEHS